MIIDRSGLSTSTYSPSIPPFCPHPPTSNRKTPSISETIPLLIFGFLRLTRHRFTPRGSPFLAFSFPQLRQLRASGYSRLHVLHRNPFERTMRVVLAAKQIWGWKAELGQA